MHICSEVKKLLCIIGPTLRTCGFKGAVGAMHCLEVKREYYQNCSVTQLQSVAHLYEPFNFLQVQQIGFVTLGPLRCTYGGCLELYHTLAQYSARVL